MIHHNLKLATVLAGLLFLVATAAMATALPLDTGSSGYAVTGANPPLMGDGIPKKYTPKQGCLGEAVVGAGDYIYIARCCSRGDCDFWRYNPDLDLWIDREVPKDQRFKNGAALAWDGENCIYCLLGAAYEDKDHRFFYRYSISDDSWEPLNDTFYDQGAGDAITWANGSIYAIIGNRKKGSAFARYDCTNDKWNALPFNWTSTDDGASLVWTGGEYLYALRGEWQETDPNQDFARYNITNKSWKRMKDIPENESLGSGGYGVGDGASLLWVGGGIPEYSNYIFALGGGGAYDPEHPGNETPGYNFYSYCISHDAWKELKPIQCPVGKWVGNRLGFADGHIYYWQGSPSTWSCGGNAFFMFEFESLPPSIFDTGPGTYSSIFGVHNGTITPAQTIVANKLYTYPCKGTGGHTEYIKIGNTTWNATATWKGYKSDWRNVTFDKTVVLRANETYDYTIRTGSYPQIHHTPALPTASGWINCTEFVDANGKRYNDWIPAIKLK